MAGILCPVHAAKKPLSTLLYDQKCSICSSGNVPRRSSSRSFSALSHEGEFWRSSTVSLILGSGERAVWSPLTSERLGCARRLSSDGGRLVKRGCLYRVCNPQRSIACEAEAEFPKFEGQLVACCWSSSGWVVGHMQLWGTSIGRYLVCCIYFRSAWTLLLRRNE